MTATTIDREELAYNLPLARSRRFGLVYVAGNLRRVRLGVPDTYFTIPALANIRGKQYRGFVSMRSGDEEMTFTPERRYNLPENPCPGVGCRGCDYKGCPAGAK